MKKIYTQILLLFFISIGSFEFLFGQDTLSSDGLLIEARKAAFNKDNYPLAKSYLFRALKISPDYADIQIFLGRINSWTKNYDSARYYFNTVLVSNPAYEDASAALTDVEYWSNQDKMALLVCNEGLKYHPSSETLLVKKAKILDGMRRYKEAEETIQLAVKINKNNTEARSIANRIKEFSVKNKVGLTYDYVYFDKQFENPWHLVSFDYSRTTGIGSVTGRINYANRFSENGVQYEMDAYPRLSKTFYTYVNVGYSDNVGIFPHWRSGLSLFANLPKSYEAELGFRYLQFSADPTWIYTGYLGKYYKSWLFGLRTYLTPGTFVKKVSASYSASARYYYGSANDVIAFNMGYGISPDDRLNSIQIENNFRLDSYNAGLSFKKKVSNFNVLTIAVSWVNQEYLPQTIGNQFQTGIAWLHRF